MGRSRVTRRAVIVLALAATQLSVLAVAPTLRAEVATPATVVVRTVAVSSFDARARRATVTLPIRADLVGASWTGAATGLQIRTRAASGHWSAWTEVDDDGDGPDPASRESRRLRGLRALTTPLWVGGADRVEVRTAQTAGNVRNVELTAVNVTGTSNAHQRITTRVRSMVSRALGSAHSQSGQAVPIAPAIHGRASWGAAPPAATPGYAARVQGVVIHHTASTNNYRCAQVPALLRGFQRYHQANNGWNDIGYNFLVDRCGGVWEGRAGGIIRAVIGAHTAGFNTGTVGIALIGSYAASKPTKAQLAAIDRLVAWRLDVAHVQVNGAMTLTARSSDKFPVGTQVTRRAVVGHRDLFPTSCPGSTAYGALSGVSTRAARSGGLKVMNVQPGATVDQVTGEVTHLAMRSLTNSRAATSVVTVERISDGRVVATRSVTGLGVLLDLGDADLRVDGMLPRVWDLRIRVTASTPTLTARPALYDMSADFPPSPGFVVTAPPVDTIQPAAAPPANQLHIGYTLATSTSIGVWLRDPTTGERAATVRAPARRPATTETTYLDLDIPASVPAGTYVLEMGDSADPAPGRSLVRRPLTVVR
ncbi:MAG: cspA [Thermoleophilia bacterium]|nr:cspA [Thermoleophilia bacterium]